MRRKLPLEGVSLKLTPVEPSGAALRGTTDENGQYRFENLWPGVYELTEEGGAAGHYKFEPKRVEIEPNGRIIVNGVPQIDGILAAEDPVAELVLKKTKEDETIEATYGAVLRFATGEGPAEDEAAEGEEEAGSVEPSTRYHQLVFTRQEGQEYTLIIEANDRRLNGRLNGVNFINGVATIQVPRAANGQAGREIIVRLPLSVSSAEIGVKAPDNLPDNVVLTWQDGRSVTVAAGQQRSLTTALTTTTAAGQAPLPGATLQLVPVDAGTLEDIEGRAPISATSDGSGRLKFENVSPGAYRLEETNCPLGYSEIAERLVIVDAYGYVTIDGEEYTEGFEIEDPVRYGGFDILKDVAGDNADPDNDLFQFTIRVYDSREAYANGEAPSTRINTLIDENLTYGAWGEDAEGETRQIMFVNGVATIYLKKGEKAEVMNLKEGMYYVVTEELGYNNLNTRYVPQAAKEGQVAPPTMVEVEGGGQTDPDSPTDPDVGDNPDDDPSGGGTHWVEQYEEVPFNNLAPKEILNLAFDKQVNSGPVDEVYDGRFRFALYKEADWFVALMGPREGAEPFQTAVNAKDEGSDNYNQVSFPTIEYTYADVANETNATKRFVYYAREEGVGDSGLIMDTTVYKIVDTVSYDEERGFSVTRVMTKFSQNDNDTWTESAVTAAEAEGDNEDAAVAGAPTPVFNNTGRGTLVIGKSLVGNATEADREFEVYLRLTTASGAAVTQEQLTRLGVKATKDGNDTALTLEDAAVTCKDATGAERTLEANGYAKFLLKGSEAVTISELRPGWQYEVFEKDYAGENYQTTIRDGSGAIETSVSKRAAVYNARNGVSIHKTNLDGTQTLMDAQFKLVRMDRTNEIELGENGAEYLITLSDGTGRFLLPLNTEELLGQSGVSGVEFRLYEVTPPRKYALPVHPWTITVKRKIPTASEEYIPGQWDIELRTKDGTVIELNKAPEGGDATYDGYYDLPNTLLNPVELVKIPEHKYSDWLEREDGSYPDGLAGATFTLYSAYDEDHLDNPSRTVVAQNYEGTELKDMRVDDGGRVSLGLLKQGTYYLVETVPPPGYERIGKPIQITIDIDSVTYSISDFKSGQPLPAVEIVRNPEEGDPEGEDAEEPPVEEDPQTIQVLGIPNRPENVVLPHTGGMGARVFYALGAVLILVAGTLLAARRRAARQG